MSQPRVFYYAPGHDLSTTANWQPLTPQNYQIRREKRRRQARDASERARLNTNAMKKIIFEAAGNSAVAFNEELRRNGGPGYKKNKVRIGNVIIRADGTAREIAFKSDQERQRARDKREEALAKRGLTTMRGFGSLPSALAAEFRVHRRAYKQALGNYY